MISDYAISWVLRVFLWTAIAFMALAALGGCSRTIEPLGPLPLLGNDSKDGTWNQLPQGGIDEKSNRAPTRGPNGC